MPPMNLDAFNYFLPKEKIAQKPAKVRSNSKLLVLDKTSSLMKDDRFFNLCEYLTSKDLLIFNDTKVIPARLFGSKETGGKVEIFFDVSFDSLAITNADGKSLATSEAKVGPESIAIENFSD